MAGSFFDSNVLLYLASEDAAKAECAEAALGVGGMVSVQVLNEVTHVARRKMRLSWSETRAFLDLIRGLVVVHPVTVATHEIGLSLAERYGFSTYDAMIAAAALHAGCDVLLSEDMHDGLAIEGRLRIVNPFRAGA